MWNQARYERGYNDCDGIIATRGIVGAQVALQNLDDANAVNEYEVGFSTRLNEAKEKVAR